MSNSTRIRRHWSLRGQAISPVAATYPSLTPLAIRYSAQSEMRRHGEKAKDGLRRSINIAVALIGIVLTAPLMLIIAGLVKLTSRGPVIYRQPRVGVDRRLHRGPASLDHRRKSDLGGRIFTIYKFRTMRIDQGGARQVWAADGDPRITSVGRALRAFRLDELPQLFNVLKGDMNIVGPRPEQPEIFADLREEVGHYRHRQRVLPGITGLAQVTLSYDRSLEDVKRKVELDLEYIRRRSATNDLIIMAKTMPVMVFRKGAI